MARANGRRRVALSSCVLPRAAVLLFRLLCASAAWAPAAWAQQDDAPRGGASAPAGSGAAWVDPTFGVRPGDVVRVWVWREVDLSGEFAVDSRGRLVLPLLGEVSAAGKSGDALSEELTGAYARYLRNPSIQVTVLRRVAVQGQVAKPGLYPVDATVSVGDVIALAGGVTGQGNGDKIRLVREGEVLVTQLRPETVLERSPVQSGDEIFVPERSWLSRNSGTLLLGGLSVAGALVVTFLTQ